jgi:hypothetical protein
MWEAYSVDIVTIKYNSSGAPEWIARYSHPDSLADYPVGIAVDPSGNIIVSGQSNSDVVTIQYSRHGEQTWLARRPGHGASGFTVDAHGAVYVVGDSACSMSSSSIVVVKYNSSGVEQWVRRLSSPGFDAILAEKNGKVYVTSHSVWFINTWKLDREGEVEWVRTHGDSSRPVMVDVNSLSVDESGNVILAGTGGMSSDIYQNSGSEIFTIKYDSLGSLQWANSFSDPDRNKLRQTDLVHDLNGDCYVLGTAGGLRSSIFVGAQALVLKYSSSGALLWDRRFTAAGDSIASASAIAMDSAGDVVVAGSGGSIDRKSFSLFKSRPSGSVVWETKPAGSGVSYESFGAMTVDANGNVFVAASSGPIGSSIDFLVSKFDSRGKQIWTSTYDSPSGYNDYPSRIATDDEGNVYVAGLTLRGYEYFCSLVKYGSSGELHWGQSIQLTWNYYAGLPRSLVVDRTKNVYVAGSDAVVKFDSRGRRRMTIRDTIWCIAVDQQNILYYATPTRVVKVDSVGGAQLFALGGASAITFDDSGNVYVTQHRDSDWHQRTSKYSPSGALRWSVNKGGTEIFLDDEKNVIVKKKFRHQNEFAHKFSNAGSTLWTVDVPYDKDIAPGVVDQFGNLYLMGRRYDSFKYSNTILKFTAAGTLQWAKSNALPDGSLSSLLGMGVDAVGTLYVGGNTQRNDFSTKVAIVCFENVLVPVGDAPSAPVGFALRQNYPNPFNPTTTIEFSLRQSGFVSLKVYDVLGREVATLANEQMSAGNYRATFDAQNLTSGTYIYALRTNGFSQAKRFVVIK